MKNVTEADKTRAKIDTYLARLADPTIPADAWKDYAVAVAESRREESR